MAENVLRRTFSYSFLLGKVLYSKKKCFYNWNEALEEMNFNLKL